MNIFPDDCVVERAWDKALQVHAEAGRPIAFKEWRDNAHSWANDMRSRLYLEAHITVKPPTLAEYEAAPKGGVYDFEEFANVVSLLGWRASMFAADEVDGITGKWFASSRAERLTTIAYSVLAAVSKLEEIGLVVERWKIEDTLFDSKQGDAL